ncbi:hypothetical protein H5410_046795 [Solanum commersonii]|uniref:Uncharacterized protein n=1 Tax=Solanum commersonii TaxID=4109 RepID=A0A9J5XD84_SOLCO|nr:hypothetical protein H5410_046795 [Solanum commersonii]
MDKKHKIDHGDAIMAVHISSIPLQAGVLLLFPISCVPLNVQIIDAPNSTRDDTRKYALPAYTYFKQRRQNWIIKNSSHRDGSTIDNVYHHLETKEKFRYMIEVYKFLLFREILEKYKKSSEKGETLQVTQIRKTRIRGNKLIKHYVVGTCESCNGVYIKDRSGVNYLSKRDIPSNIEKRENEDLFGHQHVNLGTDALSAQVNSGDVAISSPVKSFVYLWDFELLT